MINTEYIKSEHQKITTWTTKIPSYWWLNAKDQFNPEAIIDELVHDWTWKTIDKHKEEIIKHYILCDIATSCGIYIEQREVRTPPSNWKQVADPHFLDSEGIDITFKMSYARDVFSPLLPDAVDFEKLQSFEYTADELSKIYGFERVETGKQFIEKYIKAQQMFRSQEWKNACELQNKREVERERQEKSQATKVPTKWTDISYKNKKVLDQTNSKYEEKINQNIQSQLEKTKTDSKKKQRSPEALNKK